MALRQSANQVSVQLGSSQDAFRWFVVHSLPHREFRAENQLVQQGFRAFLPKYLKTTRHARQFRTVKASFFPRYLFVRMNLAQQPWRSVNGTFGVASLVMEGDFPKPVPFGIVENLVSISDAEGLLSFEPQIQPGGNVRILTGPFAEQVGKLIRTDPQGRVQILLEIMGAQVIVHSAGRQLAPIA